MRTLYQKWEVNALFICKPPKIKVLERKIGSKFDTTSFSVEESIMKCPYCNKEMESGYVQCRDGLHWTPKKQKVAVLSGMGKGAIAIGNENGYMANSFATAFHCDDCKTVIIQYGKSKEDY